MSKVYISGVKQNQTKDEIKKVITEVFLKASNNLEWLKEGDLVFLKPALNSSSPYPATTDPLSLEAVSEAIKAKGGRVVVGDQCGVEHVVHSEEGVVKGDSEKIFIESKMGNSDQYDFVAFEKTDWNNDFYNYKVEGSDQWPNGFWVTDLVKKADHIINLPRVSTHVQAGVTLGFKSLVGLLRQDSRMEFHSVGPFFNVMKKMTSKSGIQHDYEVTGDFWKKITEIYKSIESKNRLTLFSGTQAQVTFGPDAKIAGMFKSKVAKPETGLIFASTNPISAEVFAIVFITILYNNLSNKEKKLEKFSKRMNGMVQELGQQSVWENPYIQHALDLNLGEKGVDIETISSVPVDLVDDLKQLLK